MEVVEPRVVVDDDRVGPCGELRDRVAVRVDERDRDAVARADVGRQRRILGAERRGGQEQRRCEQGRGEEPNARG
jgi:hypothetical protein